MNKKLLALFLACLLPLALLAGSGDVNGDGKVDEIDAKLIADFIMGYHPENFNVDEADVNVDGQVNAVDIVQIINEYLTTSHDVNIEIIKKEFSLTDSRDWQHIEITLKSASKEALEGVEWQVSDDCKDWIEIFNHNISVSDDVYFSTLYVSIAPNISQWMRDGEILFSNATYSFQESVKIQTESFISLKKDELHIANQQDRQLYIGIESNLIWENLGDFSYEIVGNNCDWINITGSSIEYDINETGKIREALILVKNEKHHFCETIKIIHHPGEIANLSGMYHIIACQPLDNIVEIPIIGGDESLEVGIYADNLCEDEDIADYIQRLPDEIRDGIQFVRLAVSANTSTADRHAEFYVRLGDCSPEWFHLLQPGKDAPSFAEQKEALKVLYNTTNGTKWKNNTNWLSDKPVNEWYGVNNDIMGDYIIRLDLRDNNLCGEIPSELSKLMPKITSFPYYGSSLLWQCNLENNNLYGKIPESVKHHPSWGNIGWETVIQNSSSSDIGQFEYDGFNLISKDSELIYMVEEKNGANTAYDIIHNNNLTLVYHAGNICPDWAWFTGISDNQVNLFMDYRDKGLGMVVVTGRYWDAPFEPFTEYVLEKQEMGMPESIHWLKDSIGSIEPHRVATYYLLDKEGNLVQVFSGYTETYCLSKIDSVCKARLGTPEEHERFISSYYVSTDYSRDGEVVVLQQATEGFGVDLVFMGDAYVDTDMEVGGKYEVDMRASMECFFAVEPYRSLRDRFNVYAVKVISPSAHFGDGYEQKLNFDDAVCFEYAQKIEGVDMDNVAIVNIVNKSDWLLSGHTNMYETGSSVAHIETGGPSSIIVHEAGGHGIAKLLDEYIYSGYEDNHTQDGYNQDFRNWIKETYHDKGWGMNISSTDNADEVPWAHFLKDDRYKDEIGIFKGAWMWPEELWRPSENSVMNSDYSWYNAPSREAIYKRVMKLSEGDDWTYDYETFVAFDAPAREAYKVAQARSRTRGAEAQPKRRIESRPPTIYKGTWRDAGKCEKIEPFKK